MATIGRCAAFAGLLLLAAGCGGGGSGTTPSVLPTPTETPSSFAYLQVVSGTGAAVCHQSSQPDSYRVQWSRAAVGSPALGETTEAQAVRQHVLRLGPLSPDTSYRYRVRTSAGTLLAEIIRLVEFEGAVYHVAARGNERRAVFRDDKDRKRFVETLGEMVERFSLRVHAYCLMPNHYHLVVGTPLGNLSQAVGWLQVTYTVRFNRRWRRSGHLFQGRFKAQLVEPNEYAQWLVEYVHLNPVRPRRKGEAIARERAGELEAYRWSSHREYAGLRKTPGWLCLDWRRYWVLTDKETTRGYRQRMASLVELGEVASPWEKISAAAIPAKVA